MLHQTAALVLLLQGEKEVLHEDPRSRVLAVVHVVLENALDDVAVALGDHHGARVGAAVLRGKQRGRLG